MSAQAVVASDPWAFWAPTPDEIVEHALDLAGVGPGMRFLDLGCGDGRVLIAAARRGASVRGVEINPRMAAVARANLKAASVTANVEAGDMFSACLEADVIYAYLTPVTLSLLRPGLARLRPGTRIVTPRYPITGFVPSAVENGCHLYELPAQTAPAPRRPGWPSRATVMVLPVDLRVLAPLTFTADCGAVRLALDEPLARASEHAVGPGALAGHAEVPIDLMFKPHGEGSAIAGEISAQGHELTVAAVFARRGFGQWNFRPDQGAQFRMKLDAAIAASRKNQ